MKILITGVAGFIGFHLAKKLLTLNFNIIAIDNLNNYYDISLKKDRLKVLENYSKKNNKKFQFIKTDIKNSKKMNQIFLKNKFSLVFHLAAQAGVRFSIKNPDQYLESNIIGFYKILNLCKKYKTKHLLFASSSSVYGNSKKYPSQESSNTDSPVSFYAASKKTNEVMAYAYANIYNLPVTALRFFTVYGPYGRPDMSLYKFFKNIINKKPINVFNFGKHVRDFTYIDDAIEILIKIKDKRPKGKVPYQCFNVANGKPHKIMNYIKFIKEIAKQNVKINYLKLQKGDVEKTYASNKLIKRLIKKIKVTSLKDGLKKYYSWYINYYN